MEKQRTRTSIAAALFCCALFLTNLSAQEESLPPGDRSAPTSISRIADAGEAEDHKGVDYIIVYDKAANRMKDSGVTYVDSIVLYKVLTLKGCTTQSVLRWNYEPQSSYVEVREVNIIRYSRAISVDVKKVRDLPAPQSAIYWSDRIKTLQLPRLQVNDGIEVKTFRKGYTYALLDEPSDERFIPPMAGEYFDIVLFQANVPIVEKKYEFVMPRYREKSGSDRRLHARVYNGPLYSSIRYSKDKVFYSWWVLNMPARPSETSQAAQSDTVPKVVMSTAESWEAKSRWFFDVNRNQFKVTPEIQAKVDEILEGAGLSVQGTEAEKAEVLLHWVAQNIRYSGQTMGEGEGFTLHPGRMIFEQRCGVCKDIAGMLVTMMRAAGMDSYAAMTMAGSRIEDLPADQFNHCVVALRKKDGSFEMYDPTWVPYNNDIWSKLETEQQYLIGTPEGCDLATIRYSPPEESCLKVEHKARILDDGTLEGTFTFQGKGASDSRLRRLGGGRSRKSELKDYFAGILSQLSSRVEAIQYKTLPLDDVMQDMWIEVSYRVPEFALTVHGGLEFFSPMMKVTSSHNYLFRAAATTWKTDRKADVMLWYTQFVDGKETIILPDGYKAVETPKSREINAAFASFKGWSEASPGELRIFQQAEVKRRQIPPDGFESFYQAMEEVKNWTGQTYRVKKGGAK